MWERYEKAPEEAFYEHCEKFAKVRWQLYYTTGPKTEGGEELVITDTRTPR